SITSAFPKLSNIDFTSSNSISVISLLGINAVIPSPTKAGVLGIALTTFIFLLNSFWVVAISIPAAIVTTITSSFTSSLISSITSEYLSGFTDKNNILADFATFILSLVILTLYVFFKSINFSSDGLETNILLDGISLE